MTMLAESKALFVRRWGEMGGYWGINRTMAEIHALLFVSDHALCTDDVMARLEISRGNASMNLRSLVDWGLIDRVHERGDRKEYFTCRTNAWEMFETIIRLRRRREVEPIVETIARCRNMVSEGGPEAKAEDVAERRVYVKRLEEMHDFLEVVGAVVDVMLKVGPSGIGRISRMIAKIAS
jgi:HTH-type transcriptional regulator, glycine betaine synthesis regulator